MPTFQQAILDASTLSSPNTVQLHMNNLNAGGGGITLLEVSAIEVVVEDEEYQAVVVDDTITIIIEDE